MSSINCVNRETNILKFYLTCSKHLVLQMVTSRGAHRFHAFGINKWQFLEFVLLFWERVPFPSKVQNPNVDLERDTELTWVPYLRSVISSNFNFQVEVLRSNLDTRKNVQTKVWNICSKIQYTTMFRVRITDDTILIANR